MKKLWVLILICGLFIIGCSPKGTSSGPVLAKIDGAVITKEEFINKINRVPEWARANFKTEEGKKEFLNELIKEQLIYQDAIKNGLQRDKEVEKEIEAFKKMTLIKGMLEREIEKNAKLDPKEVRDFYDKNTDRFVIGTEVRAKHILVDTEEQAKDILKRIRQKEDFSKLAERYSKDKGSAKNGGDLGSFSRGRMVPQFEAAAFSLKVGEVSGPVRTQFGYHIIQVTDKKEGRIGTFEEVKGGLEKQLMIEKQKALFDSYIEKLKKNSKIETAAYESELKALNLDLDKEKTP